MHGMPPAIQRYLVRLDVGGTLYTVNNDTLLKFPESMLSKMAIERRRFSISDGDFLEPIFIDRDGDRFKYVLDGYRDGAILIPRTVAVGSLEKDLVFFGLSKVVVKQERPTFDECLLGSKEGILELSERLKEMLLEERTSYNRLLLGDKQGVEIQCSLSLCQTEAEIRNCSENFALWAVREAIQQYMANNDVDYEAFLHEYLTLYPSNYSRPDLSHALAAAYKIVKSCGLCSINVVCTRRYNALAFSFSGQAIGLDGQKKFLVHALHRI
jgi:BTB/POZ domain